MIDIDAEALFELFKYDKLEKNRLYKFLLLFTLNLIENNRYNYRKESLILYFNIIPPEYREQLNIFLENNKDLLPNKAVDKQNLEKLIEHIELQLKKSKPRRSDFLASIKCILTKIYESIPKETKLRLLFDNLFNLNEYEWDTLLFIHWYTSFELFHDLIDAIQMFNDQIESMVAIMTGYSPEEIIQAEPYRNLSEKGLLNGFYGPLIPNDILIRDIRSLLNGRDVEKVIAQYTHDYAGLTFPLNTYPVMSDDNKLINILLSNTGNNQILIHGSPGTGKSSYAAAAILHSGRTPVFITIDEHKNNKDIYTALRMVTKIIDDRKHILVVDEADYILNDQFSFFDSPKSEKGVRNRLLESIAIPVIWITNQISRIPSSTRRRFKYNVCFQSINREHRLSIWQEQIKHYPETKKYLNTKIINVWADIYNIPASSISSSLESAEMINSKTSESVIGIIKQVIENQVEFLPGITSIKNNLNNNYSMDLINTDSNIENLIISITNYYKIIHNQSKEKNPFTILFYGIPGTGKTALGHYIASRLGKDLLLKQSADLKSKWVGETEKQIKEAFIEAEQSESLLLIDEADSFIFRRNNARAEWEISAVNQFLSSMENFNGVLICTTNRSDFLDPASLRRFVWKIEFNSLTLKQRILILQKYFPDFEWFEKYYQELNFLEGLTPGDVAAVWKQLQFNPKKKSTNEIISLLQDELRIKDTGKNQIGF